MFEIVVEDEFSAAHFLKLYDGSWEHRHGHDWKVAVTVQSAGLDSMGVVMDFEVLKPALRKILGGFETISMNDEPTLKKGSINSSTENIAKLIFEKLLPSVPPNAKLKKVTVWETPDACASYFIS